MSDDKTGTETRIEQLCEDWQAALSECIESNAPPEQFGQQFAGLAQGAAQDLATHYETQMEDEFQEHVVAGMTESEALRAVLFGPVAEGRALQVVSAACEAFKPESG